jgi:hypothetical protein
MSPRSESPAWLIAIYSHRRGDRNLALARVGELTQHGARRLPRGHTRPSNQHFTTRRRLPARKTNNVRKSR